MKTIAAALVKAQKDFGPALKSKNNPAFRSKYADLGACIEAVIDALNDNGITLLQRTHPDETGVTVETVLMHESGESWSSGPLHVPAAKQDPQGYGSALTYARRYSLMAACGIAPEDDDGNAASRKKPEPEPAKHMDPRVVQQWLEVISQAAPDEVENIVRDGLDAATEVKDREAYAVIRTAGKRRQENLALAVTQ